MHTRIILGLCLQLAAFTVQADGGDLSPSKVFELASPSIVIVQARDKSGAVIEMGSGVAVSHGVVVSNCHVFTTPSSDTATIQYNQKILPAALLNSDTAHDLCSFTVKGLAAPPVKLGTTSQLKVGEQAFAIGAPEGLELTLSGGLISSLRSIPGGVVLQVTTPISPGSSGGGLFDGQARLIGITSYYMKEGQQLNFALPVEWISELPKRGILPETTISDARPTATQLPHSSGMQHAYQAITAGDYAEAFTVLQPLAAQGNTEAETWLAVLYADGTGVPQDYGRAVALLGQAANAGNARAVAGLGVLYEQGRGVAQDAIAAYALFNLSAAIDSTPDNQARNRRTTLSGSMTAAQIEAGQQMTRDMQQAGVLIALGRTRPPRSASAGTWSRYLGLIMQRNMQGMTADRPYPYLVPAGDSDEAEAKYDRQLKNVQDTVARGMLPGNMLVFAGAQSSQTANLIIAAFQVAKPGSFDGAIILFIGDQIDVLRVQHAIAKTGAKFRFAEMK